MLQAGVHVKPPGDSGSAPYRAENVEALTAAGRDHHFELVADTITVIRTTDFKLVLAVDDCTILVRPLERKLSERDVAVAFFP